jgi:hypothetical protein
MLVPGQRPLQFHLGRVEDPHAPVGTGRRNGVAIAREAQRGDALAREAAHLAPGLGGIGLGRGGWCEAVARGERLRALVGRRAARRIATSACREQAARCGAHKHAPRAPPR